MYFSFSAHDLILYCRFLQFPTSMCLCSRTVLLSCIWQKSECLRRLCCHIHFLVLKQVLLTLLLITKTTLRLLVFLRRVKYIIQPSVWYEGTVPGNLNINIIIKNKWVYYFDRKIKIRPGTYLRNFLIYPICACLW